MITLTKREQILCLELLKNPISKEDQTAYKSHAFYFTICKLKKIGLVESVKSGRSCKYRLTFDGLLIFSLIANFKGNEEFKPFKLKGTKLISFD